MALQSVWSRTWSPVALGASPKHLHPVAGGVVFAGLPRSELHFSDGTAAGTRRIFQTLDGREPFWTSRPSGMEPFCSARLAHRVSSSS